MTRALIATAIFSSAYMAEVIRGGLQAIPRGQYEAAQALAQKMKREFIEKKYGKRLEIQAPQMTFKLP